MSQHSALDSASASRHTHSENGSLPSQQTPTKHQIQPNQPSKDNLRTIDKHSMEYVIRSGIAGGISGSAAKTLIAPLDRIKILFQTSNPEFIRYRGSFMGMLRAGQTIYANDGFQGLFQGHSVTLLRIFPYAAIKFVAYEQIRSLMIPNDSYENATRRFLAGSVSGLASVFFTYPLDLVRVRLAFETPNLSHNVPGHDHKAFFSHHKGRLMSILSQVYNEHPPQRQSDPSWIRYTREKLPTAAVQFSNFYRGFGPTMLGMIPYAGVSFYVHDIVHDIFRSKPLAPYCVADPKQYATNMRVIKMTKNTENVSSRDSRVPLRTYAQLFAGGLSGMLSQTAAYPFEVIRRRMQVSGVIKSGGLLSFKQTVKLIFAENGVKGFYVGLTIGYMKVIPMVACTFFVYERCKLLFGI